MWPVVDELLCGPITQWQLLADFQACSPHTPQPTPSDPAFLALSPALSPLSPPDLLGGGRAG